MKVSRADVCFVVPSIAAKAYQQLASVYSAIETPTWALLLASAMRAHGWEPAILDFEAQPAELEDAVELIADFHPKLAIFVMYGQNPNSGTTSMIGAGVLASQLRRSHPDIKIAFVGSHVSALPQYVVKLSYVDIAFINDGVSALLALLDSDFKTLDKVPGIWYKDEDGKSRSGASGSVVPTQQMDTVMPGYAWDLLPYRTAPLDLYRAHFWHTNFLHEMRTPFAAIYTSLGCQFGCSFCMINIVNRTSYESDVTAADSRGMRFWSPELMLGEFQKLWDMGVRTLRISDEMFFLNRKYYVPILEGLISRGMKFNLWAYARVDSVLKEQLELFKAAGINWLCLGIEAGNQLVRLEIEKGKFQQIDIRRVVGDIKDAGISVLGNYIFGFPDDTIKTMTETLDLSLELQCEHANFYAAQALPGSPLYMYAKKEGWDIPENPEEFAFLSYDCRPLRTKYLEASDVLRFRDDAWHRYFSDPGYLGLVERKFGSDARANIQDLAKIRLKRKLLGD